MKRDLDKIRQILFDLEKETKPRVYFEVFNNSTFEYGEQEILIEHLILMREANLLEFQTVGFDSGNIIIPGDIRITWEGYEFLEQIKNDSIWKEAKQILSKTNTFTIPLVTNVLSSLLTKSIGI